MIIGNTAYIQNNAVQVFAIDLTTGLNKWKYDPKVVYTGSSLPRASSSHGITYFRSYRSVCGNTARLADL